MGVRKLVPSDTIEFEENVALETIKAKVKASALSGFAVAADLATGDNPAKGAWLVANAVVRVENVAALRALPAPDRKTVVFMEGYYEPGDGGGGMLVWMGTSNKADNGGTVFVPDSAPSNGRWERGPVDGFVPIRWFGAKGDGVTSDAAAFASACATPWVVLVDDGDYKITPFANYAHLQGRGRPTLLLDNNAQRGIQMQSGSGIADFDITFTISSAVTPGAVGAVYIGEFITAGTLYENIRVSRLNVTGAGAVSGHGITMFGNVRGVLIEDCVVDRGSSLNYGISAHWGGDSSVAPIAQSWHPREIRIMRCKTQNFAGSTNGFSISAGLDVDIEDCIAENCGEGLVIKAGDVGGAVAQGIAGNRVLSGVHIKNFTIKNPRNYGLLISCESYDYAGSVWLGGDSDMSVKVDGLTIELGADSTNCSPLRIVHAANVDVSGLNICYADGTALNNENGVYVFCSRNVKVKGRAETGNGTRLVNVIDWLIDLIQERPTSTTTVLQGVKVEARRDAITLAAALSVGDTTLQVSSVPQPLARGSRIWIGTDYVTLSRGQIASGAATTLQIWPSVIAAASGAAASAEQTVTAGVIDGAYRRYRYGVELDAANSSQPDDIEIRARFSHCGEYDVLLDNCRNVRIRGARFERGNQLDAASGANIRAVSAVDSVLVMGCEFEQGASKVARCINISASSVGIRVLGNAFLGHKSGAAALTLPGSAIKDNNYLAAGLTET